jgi:hypothetical protein
VSALPIAAAAAAVASSVEPHIDMKGYLESCTTNLLHRLLVWGNAHGCICIRFIPFCLFVVIVLMQSFHCNVVYPVCFHSV